KKWQNVSALESTANDYISRRVNAVDLKNRFGDVETDCRDRLHLGSSESWGPQQHPHPWHFRAGGGAVHSINSGLVQCSKRRPYSIPSSARERKDSGIVRPSNLAVLRFTISSNLVGS